MFRSLIRQRYDDGRLVCVQNEAPIETCFGEIPSEAMTHEAGHQLLRKNMSHWNSNLGKTWEDLWQC